MKRTASVALAGLLCACGSEYTIVDRSTLVVSASSRTSARSLLPSPERYPAVVEHLALAQELFDKQLRLLQERRNKVRARKRDLGLAAFGVLGATGLGVGGMAIGAAAQGDDPGRTLVTAGAVSLAGVGLSAVLQIASLLQEDPAQIDQRRTDLMERYNEMLQQVQSLGAKVPADAADAGRIQSEMGRAIEKFINAARQINVKG
jgi:hypothetical protein